MGARPRRAPPFGDERDHGGYRSVEMHTFGQEDQSSADPAIRDSRIRAVVIWWRSLAAMPEVTATIRELPRPSAANSRSDSEREASGDRAVRAHPALRASGELASPWWSFLAPSWQNRERRAGAMTPAFIPLKAGPGAAIRDSRIEGLVTCPKTVAGSDWQIIVTDG